MKKGMIVLLLSCVVMFTWAASAEKTAFYTISYHSNVETSESVVTVDKEPGQEITIRKSIGGKIGLIFAGWATTRDAEKADYLPGDLYTKDENIDLYAVWMQPYELGEFDGPETVTIPAFPVNGTNVYIQFTVREPGYYRLRSVEESLKNATTFSSIEILEKKGSHWETFSRGQYITDETGFGSIDFTAAADFKAGTTYLLSFYCPPNPVKLEVENRISFISYHSNLESSDSITTTTKEHGEAIEIRRSTSGKIGKIFAGWATNPNAETAEYFPGDLYSEDESIDLYAVWMDACELGELAGPATITIPAFPVSNERVYLQFSVAESGYYRLQSMEESMKNAKVFSNIEIMKKDGNYWETISRGKYLSDDFDRSTDFTVAAELEAGETYMLEFICPPNPVKLEVENRISFITYHSNLESYDSTTTVDKEPGESIEIRNSTSGKTGKIFAGWATAPDAETAEYFPGDLYSRDESVDLYAVWMDAYELGELRGPETWIIPAFPVGNERVYLAFTVSESGSYRLQSLEESMKNATTFSSIEIMKKDANDWETISRGHYIMDEEDDYRSVDFTITAEMMKGESYLLSFYCPSNSIKLRCEPQYEPEPYDGNVRLPESLSVVETEMFAGASLESVYIPVSVKKIAAGAFQDCVQLTKVVIAAEDVQIDENAFSGCGKLLIIAPEESAAHSFAEKNGYEFRRLSE